MFFKDSFFPFIFYRYIDKEHKFRTASHLPAAAVQEIDDVKDHRQVAAQAHEGEKITEKRDNKVDEPPKKKLRGRNKKRPIVRYALMWDISSYVSSAQLKLLTVNNRLCKRLGID